MILIGYFLQQCLGNNFKCSFHVVKMTQWILQWETFYYFVVVIALCQEAGILWCLGDSVKHLTLDVGPGQDLGVLGLSPGALYSVDSLLRIFFPPSPCPPLMRSRSHSLSLK